MNSHRASKGRNLPDKSSYGSKKYEEYALVLDIIDSHNNSRKDRYSHKTVIQAIGVDYFSLLELIPVNPAEMTLMQKISLGKDRRSTIETIIGRITFDKLTSLALKQLDEAIITAVKMNEDKIVNWFNSAQPVSIRLHSLQLIKGIGPKVRNSILKARKESPFSSFSDIEERTGIKDVVDLVKSRILDELKGDENHYLFTRAPPREYDSSPRRKY